MLISLLFLAVFPAQDPAAIRIGFHRDLFKDMDPKTVTSSLEDFSATVAEQTRRPSRTQLVDDAHALCRALHDGKFDFAVLASPHLFWELARFPEMRPLIVAVNVHPYPRVIVVRSARGTGKSDATLGCVIPGRPHDIFYGTLAAAAAHARMVPYPNAEDLLDDVVDGKVGSAAVDLVSWERFQARKPVRARFLRVTDRSPEFLPTTVLYRKGAVSDATLSSYKDSLLRMPDTVRGRDLMTSWRLTAFREVPDDFSRRAAALAKECPEKGGK